MRIYFIRHGETDWNKEGRLQGRVDIPLNEEGRFVAEITRDALLNVPFAVAFSSPLKRACETAEIIIGERNVPIIKDDRIIEVDFGDYEGVKRSDWDENIKKFFFQSDEYEPKGNGETIEQVLQREQEFLQEVFANETYWDKVVLVSTHGAALSGLLTVIKENPIEKYWAGGLHKNCGITIVDVENGIPKIIEEAIVVYDERMLMKG